MVKFEFIEVTDRGHSSYRVKVNGLEDKNSHRLGIEGKVYISLYSEKICNIIRNEKIADLLEEVDEIEIPLEREYAPKTIEVNDSANVSIKKDGKECTISVEFQYDYEYWSKGYSVPDIVNKLKEVNRKNNHILFSLNDSETTLNGFIFSKVIQNTDIILKDEIKNLTMELQATFQEAVESFEYYNKDSIYFEFDIDKPMQVASKQYLMYFIQFLEDIGIEAESSMKDEPKKIMFEVIPKDKTVALDNIRKCLEIYLGLIDNKELELYQDYSNVAVMQLKANINHLNNQIMLANTIIEQKQVTIDLLRSGKAIIPKEEKSEISLLNGAVKIKEFQWKGLIVNPAQVINLLKRRK